MKLLVIGCGNMGAAVVKAVHGKTAGKNVTGAWAVFVHDRSVEKMAALSTYGATAVASLGDFSFDADTMVLLAVKPQDVDGVLHELRGRLKGLSHGESLLVSIAAGVPMERLQRGSGCEAIVRVMPNTPAQIGLGASGWMASVAVTPAQKTAVKMLLEAMGIAVEVASEDELDAVTALSGCGPAYVFYFMEALMEGAEKLGLPQGAAARLTLQTVKGAAALAEMAGDGTMTVGRRDVDSTGGATLEKLKKLRAQVASKGGTTERALDVLEEAKFKKIVADAVRAAYDRAKEMR